MARIAAVDPTAEQTGSAAGSALAEIVDLQGLASEVERRNPNRFDPQTGQRLVHPFQVFWRQVLAEALPGVDHQEVREMASNICASIARLPFVPSETETVKVDGDEVSEFDAQIIRTARRAEEALDSETIWTSSARKIARAALEYRRDDPDAAWVDTSRAEVEARAAARA